MLRFLLDEHISPSVARGLRRRNRLVVALSISEWFGGEFLGQPDAACLREAAAQQLTLVTYDRRTIPPLLKAWAEQDRNHGGVIFVDDKTISPTETGLLIAALIELFGQTSDWDWANRVVFLQR